MKGGFNIVIYVDVLFVINFFITFLLLSLAARLTKRSARTVRLILASALGGAYSLIILIDLPFYLSLPLKAASAAVIVLAAFGFKRLKSFLLSVGAYLFSSFVFLGIITGSCFLFKTQSVTVNNQSVYINIGARGLLISAFFAYIISCGVVRVYNKRVSAGEIYTLKIERRGQSVTLFALADTGNRLREPFSGSPVIVASSDRFKDFNTDGGRIIPASTVNSASFLTAFKPDRVIIKNDKGSESAENVYVALSDDMKSKEYSAVFNPEILSV
ncbi:MAG: sigma-E processing peptidase SpoIIGA [Eubacterium sp.]|nr:sigma-E processing peptidase SpoIIGA [Eubacterium sp.]